MDRPQDSKQKGRIRAVHSLIGTLEPAKEAEVDQS